MRGFVTGRNDPEAEDPDLVRGKLLLTVGSLSRYFKSPISFFLDLNMVELGDWVDVMNEMIRREEKAMQDAQKRAPVRRG